MKLYVILGLVVVALFATMCHADEDDFGDEDAFEDVDDFEELEFSEAEQADDFAMVEERFFTSIISKVVPSLVSWGAKKLFKKRAPPTVGGPLCPDFGSKFTETDEMWEDDSDSVRRRRAADDGTADEHKITESVSESTPKPLKDLPDYVEDEDYLDNSTIPDNDNREGGFGSNSRRRRRPIKCSCHSQCQKYGKVCCPSKKIRGYVCRAANIDMKKHKKGIMLSPRFKMPGRCVTGIIGKPICF